MENYYKEELVILLAYKKKASKDTSDSKKTRP